MPVSDLGWIIASTGVLAPTQVQRAEQRRVLHGGGLDTVLLESGQLDEARLIPCLVQATGLPAANRDRLSKVPPSMAELIDADLARRLGGLPMGSRSGWMEIAVRPDGDVEALKSLALAKGMSLDAYVVPEVRFEETFARLYDTQPPPRHMALLIKLAGPHAARVWRANRLPVALPAPTVETGPRRETPGNEVEIEILADESAWTAPPSASMALPASPPAEPVAVALATETLSAPPAPLAAPPVELEPLLALAATGHDVSDVIHAITTLARARDGRAVPALFERLGAKKKEIAAAARDGLVALTRQDFGSSRRAWLSWWKKARGQHRVEWLLDALSHKNAELRLAASDELQRLTGVYFGYHFDLPKRDREEARRRWTDWWQTVGRVHFASVQTG